MNVKEESEKVGLKFNIQKTKTSYWKLLPIIWPSFHSLDKLIPDYNFQRVSCTIP